MSIIHATILQKTHIGPQSKPTLFTSVKVSAKSSSLTWPDNLFSEWVTIKDGKPYICRDEYDECWLDRHDEYEGEEIPLAPYEAEILYAKKCDEPIALKAAEAARKALAEALNADLSGVKIINLAKD